MGVFAVATVLLNAVGFVMFGVDKQRAIDHKTRIPETTLLLFAALGAWPAMLIAMRFFRHKTRKTLFKLGIPLIGVAWTVVVLTVWLRGA